MRPKTSQYISSDIQNTYVAFHQSFVQIQQPTKYATRASTTLKDLTPATRAISERREDTQAVIDADVRVLSVVLYSLPKDILSTIFHWCPSHSHPPVLNHVVNSTLPPWPLSHVSRHPRPPFGQRFTSLWTLIAWQRQWKSENPASASANHAFRKSANAFSSAEAIDNVLRNNRSMS